MLSFSRLFSASNLLFFVMLLCVSASGLEIGPRNDVDERLYLVVDLQQLHAQIPDPTTLDSESAADLDSLRSEVQQYAEYLATRIPELDDILERYIALGVILDDIWTYYYSQNEVRETVKREVQGAQGDAWESLKKGAASAGELFEGMKQSSSYDPESEGLASGIAVAWGAAVGVVDWAAKANEARKLTDSILQEEANALYINIANERQNVEEYVRASMTQYGWGKSEVQWRDVESNEKVNNWFANGNYMSLKSHFERQRELRPRDPRPHFELALALGEEASSSASLKQASDLSLGAATLVPAGEFYDPTRAALVGASAYHARLASDAELFEKGEFVGANSYGREAVERTRVALQLDREDVDGELRENLMYALIICGEFDQAIQVGQEIWTAFQNDAYFSLEYARALSSAGNVDDSMAWLKNCLQLGHSGVLYMKEDSALELLRTEKEAEFNALLTPQLAWSVSDDWVWDDVILQNNSAFALTGVEVRVTLRKQTEEGLIVRELELICESIPAGEAFTWVDVVEGASGHWDSDSQLLIDCNQFESVMAIDGFQ